MSQSNNNPAPETGTRKYDVRLKNGTGFTCIDLVKDPPEEVERMLREQFAHYGVESIKR